jgi:two-component system NarL family response regulator
MNQQDNAKSNPKKVLVVDDHILFREGVISLFRSAPDFIVIGEAGSVREGIESAKMLQPDIILMDFKLPDGTGLEATEAILHEVQDCTIVFLTASEEDSTLFAAIRAGAKGFLPKSLAGSDLVSSLRGLDRDEMAMSPKMSSRIVEAFSHSNQDTSAYEDLFVKLTPRELDVLGELQTGISNPKIAQQLVISENTVKHHLHNIMNKLGVKNRREAILIAQRAGLKAKLSNQHSGES